MARSGEGVRLGIRPAPTPQEREAIHQALAITGLLDRGADRSAWWLEGLREALGDENAPAPNGRWNE